MVGADWDRTFGDRWVPLLPTLQPRRTQYVSVAVKEINLETVLPTVGADLRPVTGGSQQIKHSPEFTGGQT